MEEDTITDMEAWRRVLELDKLQQEVMQIYARIAYEGVNQSNADALLTATKHMNQRLNALRPQ